MACGHSRPCALYGASITNRRADARYCSSSHRREGGRIQAILSGRGSEPYLDLKTFLGSRQRRASGPWGAFLNPLAQEPRAESADAVEGAQ